MNVGWRLLYLYLAEARRRFQLLATTAHTESFSLSLIRVTENEQATRPPTEPGCKNRMDKGQKKTTFLGFWDKICRGGTREKR